MSKRIVVILSFFAIICNAAYAESADSVSIERHKNHNIFAKVINYFSEANKPKPDKKFDFSVIGGPHYSSDSKFGLGVMGAGLYHSSQSDTLTPVSQISVYADATTAGHFKVGVCGTHIFPGDRRRLTYDVNFSRIATRFWGIGFEECSNNDNETKFKYLNSQIRVDYRFRFGKHLYAGPLVAFDYINGSDFGRPELWHGESARTFNFGVGGLFEYDSRDFLTNAFQGTYVRVEQQFNPRFIGNKYAFSGTVVHASHYNPLWKGAIFAVAVDGHFTYGNTPWGLLNTFGGQSDMRGYFQGRYRDKCTMVACVELRQHVWRRNGFVVWGGAGTIFSRFSEINWHRIMPNYGIGYRWEFKKRVNVRLDYGIGRGCSSFIFSINEAF